MNDVKNEAPRLHNGGLEIWKGGVYMGVGLTMPPHLYFHKLSDECSGVSIYEWYGVVGHQIWLTRETIEWSRPLAIFYCIGNWFIHVHLCMSIVQYIIHST